MPQTPPDPTVPRDGAPQQIEVVGVVLLDEQGRLLTVRKRGTSRFMLPGGKPEAGEAYRAAAVREVLEETGLALPEESLEEVGRFEVPAANEPGSTILSTLFRGAVPVDPEHVATAAEIEELRWLDATGPDLGQDEIAPLLAQVVLPRLRDRAGLRDVDRPRSVAVFCASRDGTDPRYLELARAVGTALARNGLGVVYGGGKVGLMGAVADAAMAAGGQVFGVIPRSLMDREVGHHGLTRLEVVESMHERKQRMAELADAFVALPGGVGTLEELFEVITWQQLGIHDKPVALVDVGGFWDPLRHMLTAMVDRGLVGQDRIKALPVLTDPAAVVSLVCPGLQASARAAGEQALPG